MTRSLNARIAGFTFLFYIAAGITGMVLLGRASGGDDVAARLASLAAHSTPIRVTAVLGLVMAFCALTLGATLRAITRDQDEDLALLAMLCRVIEGAIIGVGVTGTLALDWLARSSAAGGLDAGAAQVLAAYLLRNEAAVPATFFAVGSTIFCALLLRGRTIPTWLARLGVIASALLAVALPLEIAGLALGTFGLLVWLPMLAFEVSLGFWWLLGRDPLRETRAAG